MGKMSTWFRSTPESERLLAQERVVLGATELLAEAMDKRGISQQELAERIGVSPSEVSQRLSGRRNLSLRKFADMLHAMSYGVEARLVDRATVANPIRLMDATRVARGRAATYTRTGHRLDVVSGGLRAS
jgi:transcriptional regulator with XRE-family HTH domain